MREREREMARMYLEVRGVTRVSGEGMQQVAARPLHASFKVVEVEDKTKLKKKNHL